MLSVQRMPLILFWFQTLCKHAVAATAAAVDFACMLNSVYCVCILCVVCSGCRHKRTIESFRQSVCNDFLLLVVRYNIFFLFKNKCISKFCVFARSFSKFPTTTAAIIIKVRRRREGNEQWHTIQLNSSSVTHK